MDIYFLEASVPLTKSYSIDASGAICKSSYPLTWEFTSHKTTVTTPSQLFNEVQRHAAKGHCLLKGTIARPLVQESRAGSTDTTSATEWLVLDLDGLPTSVSVFDASGVAHMETVDIESLLKRLGLGDVTYVLQWSASYGIENQHLRAHVLMLLDRPVSAPLLKQWLIQKNHEVGVLRYSARLTKTGNAISWALDISACQNDKLIYIAPPTLGAGIKDPLPKSRISLVKKKHSHLNFSTAVNSVEANRTMTNALLDSMRELSNLPKRKHLLKVISGHEVMVKPDSCIATEIKQERGFTYFNLNGGDSWAYYHPDNSPDLILNFKGEPVYQTKELLPDYWQQITSTGSRTNTDGVIYLAFCDRSTGVYWRGTYDQSHDHLDITVAKNETQVRHFAKQYGVPLGEFIPEWDLTFDPNDNVRVDLHSRTVNQFQPTQYMLNASTKPMKRCPPAIFKLVHHVMGADAEITEHFLNWLAFIVQTRDRTKTAWVLHGVPGTGKGILFSKVLRPMFGHHQTAAQNMATLAEPYNHWMEKSFIVFIDEVQTKALINEAGVVAKLKNYITEPFISLRAMYRGAVEARNFCNFILASNMSSVVNIEAGDRRFNVAGYQPQKFMPTDEELDQIDQEVQAFYNYLLVYPMDATKARAVLDTSDRRTMIAISESSADSVGNALNNGDFQFFIDQLPSSTGPVSTAKFGSQVADYVGVLKALNARSHPTTGSCSISRDELYVLFNYVVGNMPSSPNKFTSLLKHHRIHVGDVWVNSGTKAGKERGIRVTWKDLVTAGKALV